MEDLLASGGSAADLADATKLARLEHTIQLGDQRRILAGPPLAILPPDWLLVGSSPFDTVTTGIAHSLERR